MFCFLKKTRVLMNLGLVSPKNAFLKKVCKEMAAALRFNWTHCDHPIYVPIYGAQKLPVSCLGLDKTVKSDVHGAGDRSRYTV